jgi:hypothetical protein
VTRAWSNENAKIGQQPCVPTPTDDLPYFNAGIVNEILKAAPGETVTTEVDCYSFGPLPNDMALEAQPFANGALSFQFDPPKCKNGGIVTLSITAAETATPGTDYHYQLLARLNADKAHLWRGLISVH